MTDQSIPWLTIREAALALGISELTVRRRIKDGRVTHRLQNGKYYVKLSDGHGLLEERSTAGNDHLHASKQPSQTNQSVVDEYAPSESERLQSVRPDQSPSPGMPSDDYSGAMNLDQSGLLSGENNSLLHGLDIHALLLEHSRLAEAAGRAVLLQEQVQQLEEKTRTLQDTMLSLANRNGWLESKLEEREHDVKLLTDSQRRVSWWQRLFGGGSAEV